MKKLLVMSCLLIFFTSLVYAEHCPLPKQLTHVKNAPWTVDAEYSNRGWIIDSTLPATRIDDTVMSKQATLYVQLRLHNTSKISSFCMYTMNGVNDAAVFVYNKKAIKDDSISVPPFQGNKIEGFRCDTSAANAMTCLWLNE